MITLDAERAARALAAPALTSPIAGVSIDSRTLTPGDLFVALRGERFDGHGFVEMAFAAGAAGAVVERRSWRERAAASGIGQGSAAAERQSPGPVYEVDDTLQALWALAREVRRMSGVTVFAITGSVGKTSTKDLLRAMVSRTLRATATAANQNNEIGVPLTLFSIEEATQAAIVEMGMRGLGQIAALAAVAEPDVGVITNVHPVHLELLGSVEGVARAKAEMIAGVKVGGAVVVPAGCELLSPYITDAGCRTVSFGVGSVGGEGDDADVVGWTEEAGGVPGSMLVVRWPEGEVRVEVPHLSQHQVENAVAAAAACYAAGLAVDECVAGVADVRFSGGRGDVLCAGSVCLIDDTYNANPAAVRAAIDGLVRLAAQRRGRPVAVLGDMLELGPHAEKLHEETGTYAARAGVRMLWGVGPLSVATVEGYRRACAAGVGEGEGCGAGHILSSLETSTVVDSIRPGDVVLFKASRSVHLENMVVAAIDTLDTRARSENGA